MLENRSFDHLLGLTKSKSRKISGITGKEKMLVDPKKPKGKSVRISTTPAYAIDIGPVHSLIGTTYGIYGSTKKKLKKPPMNGFIKYHMHTLPLKKAREVFSAFKPNRVPIITTLAKEFAVFDHYHCSVPGPTGPNRCFPIAATSAGHSMNDAPPQGYSSRTIFDNLDQVGKSWNVFYHDGCIACSLTPVDKGTANVKPWTEFERAAKTGHLPAFTWLEPGYAYNADKGKIPSCQHARNGAIPAGEELIKETYELLRASPQWDKLAFIITYDEGGGFWDHVPPPQKGVPSPDGKLVGSPPLFKFDRLGVRVPFVVVSPWVEKGHIEHAPKGPKKTSQYEHSSIPATLHKIFGTKSFLTKRDAWAGTFEHLFTTLKKPRTDCPKTLPKVAGNIHLYGGDEPAYKRDLETDPGLQPEDLEVPAPDWGDQPMSELACDIIKMTEGNDGNCSRSEREAGHYLKYLTYHSLQLRAKRGVKSAKH